MASREGSLVRVLKPSIRGRGVQVASAQAGTPQLFMGQASARRRSPICPRARRISSFVRMSQCCLAGRYVRNLFARGRGQSGANGCRGVCALGVARAQADAPQFVMGARFGEAAWAQCARGPGAFSRFGRILPGCLGGLNFRILAAKNRNRSGVHDGGVFALGRHLKQGWLRAPYHRQIGGLSSPS